MRQTRSSARLSRATKTEPDEKTDPLMFDKLESSPPPKAEKHESDFDDSKDDEDEFEDKETSAPKRKRARTTRTAKPAPRTKHVRGKQGRLAGLMKMPVDIFTEITRHLFPKDIITLSRSNKFFRQLLMNKSAIHIWHAAMRNVPGIPLCPPDLSEPHYLSLIYAHNCSMCGTTASRRMDEMLRARLCPSCRSSSLVNTITLPLEVRSLVLSSSKIIPTKRRWGFDLYAFKSEVTEVQNRLDEFAISGDSTGLAAWKAARSEELDTRRKQALELTLFLDEMEENRESKLSDLKKRRREDINNRLLGMGWEAEDLVIRYPRNREWSSLVDQPKVLTDRTWANLQPKLIPILEANRQDRLQRERDQRKRDRRVRLTSHLTEIKDAREPILDITIAPFAIPGSSASSSSAPSTYKVIHKGIFPDIVDALEWDRMKEFLEDDLPVEAMEAEVEQHLPELRQRASQWTVDIQDHLAALLREGYIEDGLGSDLPDASLSGPEGTDDLLENVSPNLKILLRADSLFQSTKSKLRPPLVYDAAVADTYPAPSYDLFSMEFRSKQPVDISKCKRHVEAQQAARKLLEYLGKPNATFLEMRTGIGYRCGRCQVHGVYTWEEIVDHFASKQQAWENVQKHEAVLARRGVTFRNVHDPAFETDKPLIKRLTTDEPNFDLGDMNGLVSLNDKVCRVCSGVAFLPEVRMSQQGMIAHLMDVHNISQPTSPEHYTPALWITDMFDGINDYGDSVFWAPSYDWSSDDGMDIFDEFGW